MRNLKKILAVITVIAMIASMLVVPALAEGFQYEDEATILNKLGLMEGYGLGDDTNRLQGLIFAIKAAGKASEVNAMTDEEAAAILAEKVVDADEVPAWGIKWAAYAVKNGYTSGTDASVAPKIKFSPLKGISVTELLVWVMNIGMGYNFGTDVVVAEAVKAGVITLNQALELQAKDTLIRDDVAGVLFGACKNGVNADGKKFIQSLIDAGFVSEADAVEAGLVEAKPVKPEVVSITADNLKEVTVVFNKALDKDTVKAENIKIDGEAATVSLNDDKVTVVITMTTKLDNQKDYKLVVEKVKDTDGNEIAKTEKSFRAFDATLPVAESITVTGPKNFTIEFSEPIETAGTVEVKSGSYVLGVGTPSISGKKATVELYSSLTDGTTYEVTVKDFVDYAGYKNIIKTFNLAYAKDGNAPVATVEKAEQTYVKVKFDKPVTGLVKEQFWHSFTAWTAKGIYKAEGMTAADAIVSSDSVDTVWVKFADNADDKPIREGTTVFGIEAKADSNEIKDNWGNKFASATFTITVTADKTAPEVAELKVKSEQSLEIKFSEEVVFVNDNVEVLAEDGSKIDGVSPSVSGSGKEYTISLGKDLSGKTIVVRIKDVKDKALQPNKMSLYSATLVITDKTAPEISQVTKDASNKILYVFFKEAVDNTALDKNNYGVLDANGVVTLLSKDPVFFVGNKVVKLTLTDEEYGKLGSLFVQKVKDLAGNAMAGQTISSMDDYANDKPAIDTIDAVATDKIEITFDQVLKRVDKDVFRINGTTPVAMELKTNKDGNTVVVLQLASTAKLAANIGTVSLGYDDESGKYKITNLFDVEAAYTDTYDQDDFNDKIAPSMAKTGDDFNILVNKTAKTITIEFDEPIDNNSLSKFTFKVKDYTVVSVTSGGTKNVVITVDKAITAGKLQITQELPVADSEGNEYKYDKTIEVDVPST